MSDLVLANNEISAQNPPTRAEMDRVISGLVADNDVETLSEVARQAAAMRLYEEREQQRERANHFAALCLTAEAGLGQIYLKLHGGHPEKKGIPVEIEGRRFPAAAVDNWCVLAIAQRRGQLGNLIAAAAAHDIFVSAGVMAKEARRAGTGFVPSTWARRVAKEEAERRGVSMFALLREVYSDSRKFRSALQRLSRRDGTNFRVGWMSIEPLVAALGIDPSTVPLAPRTKPKLARPQRLWLRRQHKATGGRWDECYSRFRRVLDEFQRLAPNHDPQFDEAYEHFYALEQLIVKKMRKHDLSERKAA